MSPPRQSGNRVPEAQKLIRAAGERLTSPRSAVLATLLDATEALSHHDVEERLRDVMSVDRVTVYRVLDWLTGTGLAHRIAATIALGVSTRATGGSPARMRISPARVAAGPSASRKYR